MVRMSRSCAAFSSPPVGTIGPLASAVAEQREGSLRYEARTRLRPLQGQLNKLASSPVASLWTVDV